jgi:pimeloyl-ACP methyl ester carboxylesterase
VLVHGFTDFAYGWRGVAERLAPHARVIAPDLRGHGDSDRIGAGGYYHFFDYVADLDDVIAQLVPGRFVLAGHSMGGTVATYWAGTRPERPAALALLEGLGPPDLAGGDGPARTAQWIAQWRTTAHAPKVMPTVDVAAARLRAKDPLLDEALARELAEHGTRRVEGGVVWKHDPLHLTMGPYPYRLDTAIKYWTRITCPVLMVDGADSRLNLPIEERAARRAHFADHRHVILERCGHAIPRHQPARLAELLGELATQAVPGR